MGRQELGLNRPFFLEGGIQTPHRRDGAHRAPQHTAFYCQSFLGGLLFNLALALPGLHSSINYQ